MLDKTEVLFLLLRKNICVTRIKIQERSLNTISRYNLHCGLMRSFLFTLTVKNETLAVHISGTLLASKFVMTRLNLPGYDTSAPQVTILLPLRDTWFITDYPPPPPLIPPPTPILTEVRRISTQLRRHRITSSFPSRWYLSTLLGWLGYSRSKMSHLRTQNNDLASRWTIHPLSPDISHPQINCSTL